MTPHDEGTCRLGESLPAMAFCPFCGEALPLPGGAS